MKRLLLLITICISSLSFGQQLTLEWENLLSGQGSSDASIVEAIKVNGNDEVIVGGTFLGSIEFNPSASSNIQTAQGGSPYLAKYNVNSDLLWCKPFDINLNGMARIEKVTIDNQNNIYACGRLFNGGLDGNTTSILDSDPGSGSSLLTIPSEHDYTTFIIKLDNTGIFQWSKMFRIENGQLNSIRPTAIETDSQNNILIGLEVSRDAGGVLSLNGNTILTTNGDEQLFPLIKLDSNGDLISLIPFKQEYPYTSNNCGELRIIDILTEDNGSISLVGFGFGSINFNPNGIYASLGSCGDLDQFGSPLNFGFVCQYDSNGDLVWGSRLGNGYQTLDADKTQSGSLIVLQKNGDSQFVYPNGLTVEPNQTYFTKINTNGDIDEINECYDGFQPWSFAIGNNDEILLLCKDSLKIFSPALTNDFNLLNVDSDGLNGIETNNTAVSDSEGYYYFIDQKKPDGFARISKISTPTSNLTELNSNQPKELIKIVNLLGQEVEYTPNTVLIYQYSDGTSEKVFTIED